MAGRRFLAFLFWARPLELTSFSRGAARRAAYGASVVGLGRPVQIGHDFGRNTHRETSGVSEVDIPRIFTICESSHRIHNPFSSEKLATLGQALALEAGWRILDLACGSGEMLCTWARDHHVSGTGVDLSSVFIADARARAVELGVADNVAFVHGDASGYVADEPVDVACCIGATWIGDGVPGTIELLRRSLRPGGIMLIGEPYWRRDPPDQATVEACEAADKDDFLPLPELIERFHGLGWDVVEMVLADQDSWDRYVAAQWLNIRRWLDANPDDELAAELRAELTASPVRHTRYQREYLGWGVFALMSR
ncbi:MAG TPA: class I SAM-dependent methyltransferase [Streptosporangiaceae bacterium]|nr:class I SAM-dependent methyltransferase [Streptosporangiaceae bacterium]